MAQNPNSPLNQALGTLGQTIGSITDKVVAGKATAEAYKANIIAKLEEVIQQLNALKNSPNFKEVPLLRQQLQDTQTALQEKTVELDQANENFAQANARLQQFDQEIARINRALAENQAEIDRLNAAGQENADKIAGLTEDKNRLTEEKDAAVRQLALIQQETGQLVENINRINATLAAQIETIDTIVAGLVNLDDANDAVAAKFTSVTQNITDIMAMLSATAQGPQVQGPGPQGQVVPGPGPPEYDVEANFNKLVALYDQPAPKTQYNNFIDSIGKSVVKQQINMELNNRKTNRDATIRDNSLKKLKQILTTNRLEVPDVSVTGGKSRKYKKRKTMKKRHRKTRKLSKNRKNYKGGYVYSASRDLDKASSVISASSNSKSRSNRKDKTKKQIRSMK